MEQRRNFGRIPFGTEVTLEIDGVSRQAALQDISLKGAQILCAIPVAPDPGSPCRLFIPLASDVVLRFEAEVVHPHRDRLGIKFTRLDPDTFYHLLRLLELNTGKPEQVEQELRIMAGIEKGENP